MFKQVPVNLEIVEYLFFPLVDLSRSGLIVQLELETRTARAACACEMALGE